MWASPRTRQFLSDHQIAESEQFTGRAMRDFERELFEVGVSAGTVATFHRIFKNFLGFCVREGFASDSGVQQIRGPKLVEHEPETFKSREYFRCQRHS